jgi:hypothetical protein
MKKWKENTRKPLRCREIIATSAQMPHAVGTITRNYVKYPVQDIENKHIACTPIEITTASQVQFALQCRANGKLKLYKRRPSLMCALRC